MWSRNKDQSEFCVVSCLTKMVAHVSAMLFPIIIIYSATPGSSLFSWHPTLMSIGCTLLMVEGIVIFSKSSSLFPQKNRSWKASFHYLLMASGVSCVVAGLVVIYINKEQSGKSHFKTWHGLLGIITVGYTCAQSAGGALAKYYKYVGDIIKIKLTDLKLYHATSGLLAYLLVTTTMILALQTNWAASNIHWLLWYASLACVCSSALVVMTHITTTYMPKSQQTKS
ncbi:transmembrane reductase CYB561D2-like [Physella acuta]|uniref:transmembrane reductase CYB561D2-like n=1 Tax=Physella acuta TaxID=109671 RepID=UPI0027DDD274|nr:transmembrane reductase CYB561D2-like [Physella acuta]XP_059144619.1 transmembrane reductase CYB561D2-like [Physella acuta]XP_059144620.1 transmembrane reductase CYB561D2-like [Physella acuta]XP_059144621.1 transmembrane reductase CYB561D2-like [Physella acuta]XP_059144622.1 transmembrane reductase CYB561D2-like [Physella acuta]